MFGLHVLSKYITNQFMKTNVEYKYSIRLLRNYRAKIFIHHPDDTSKANSIKKNIKQKYMRETKRSLRQFKRSSLLVRFFPKHTSTLINKWTLPRIGVVGAPLVYGQGLSGSNAAPELLRQINLSTTLTKKGAYIEDHGELEFHVKEEPQASIGNAKYSRTVGDANQKIADKVESVLKSRPGQTCLVLGGDHSVGLGSVHGHTRVNPDIVVIWVDAHADINTPLTSVSGNLHGMAVSFLVRECRDVRPPLPGLEWCTPCISASQLGYIGLRSVDEKEEYILKNLDICAFSTRDVKERGVDAVMRGLLQRLDPEGQRAIHLSFDVDVLDPTFIPATGTKVPGGLTEREALRIAKLVHSTGRLAVMDVVELNPVLVSQWLAYSSADVTKRVIVKAFCGVRHQLPWHRDMSTSGHRGKRLPRYRWRKNLRGRVEECVQQFQHGTKPDPSD